jgi:SAM-dependent methyltransferase
MREQSFCYLREARRVLRPGGRIVFSFLEFKVPDQWSMFESLPKRAYERHPLVMFFGRDAIEAWARRDSASAYVRRRNFRRGLAKLGPMGQSVCVLRKPAKPDRRLDTAVQFSEDVVSCANSNCG